MDQLSEQLATRLASEMNSWKSIELEVVDDFRNEIASTDSNMYSHAVYREHYVETALGQRLGEFLETPDGKPEKFSTYYHDGFKGADVAHAAGKGSIQTFVSIKKSYKFEGNVGWNLRPYPLRYFYLSKVPLWQSLKQSERLGEEECLGRPCVNFVFKQVIVGSTPCDMVFSLDLETGIPLKMTGYNGPRGLEVGRPSSVWRALSFDKVSGHPIPLKSEEIVYLPPSPSEIKKLSGYTPKVVFQTSSVVESVHFDRDYPATDFWPKIEPTAAVVDTISKSTVKPKVFAGTKEAQPLRAVPDRDWGASVPWISGGLGLTLLIIGLLTRLRRG